MADTLNRYTVIYEGNLAGAKILSGDQAPGRAVSVALGDLYAENTALCAQLEETGRSAALAIASIGRALGQAQAERGAAEAALAAVREVLEHVEWITDADEDPRGRWGFCLACSRERSQGHAPDCRLATVLVATSTTDARGGENG